MTDSKIGSDSELFNILSQSRTHKRRLSGIDFRPFTGYSLGSGGQSMECRLAAVLAADVVDYTRLMGADERLAQR